MNFRKSEIDIPLHREITTGMVIPAKDWDALDLPFEGNLTDVLVDNCDRIDSDRWITWLVRRHQFARVPNPEPDLDWLASLSWGQAPVRVSGFYGVFPLLKRGNIAQLVSVRPDLTEALPVLKEWLDVNRFIIFALTPKELKRWRMATNDYAQN